MATTVTFKGQLLSRTYIFSYVVISLVTFMLVFGLYYFKIYDLLFQLFNLVITGPASLMMVIVPPIFFWLYLSFLLASFYYPKLVSISLSDDDFKIEFGKTKIQILLQDITKAMFVKRNEKWDRIIIKTDKTTHINIGSIFSGITIPEIDEILNRAKKVLTKRYELYYTANTAVANNFSFTLSRNKPKSVAKKLVINLTIAFFAIGIPVSVAIFLMTRDDGGKNLLQSKSYGSSYFVRDNGKVYALKMGDGYFELKGADIRTFKPLHFEREYGSLTGKDKNNVFAVDKKIEGIDVNHVQYLGLGFTKDLENVFFRTQKISEADVESFQSLKHSSGFNTLAFTYATDTNHVYYREMIVQGANPKTVSSVDKTFDYIKDDRNAFYRSTMLPYVNVKNFHAVKTNYQIVYASDGRKHFVNGLQFPAVVNNKFWGTTGVDTSRLVILQKAKADVRHLLFSDGKAIYYYDDEKLEFICAEHLPDFKPLNDDQFTDGKFVYFTKSGNLATRKTGSYGSQTNIYSITKETEKPEKVLEIKTRSRTRFEDENE